MKFGKLKKGHLAVLVSFFNFIGVTVVAAQDGSQQDGFLIEEVIVTATKRAEAIQDVPVSITAFTADDIRQGGIQSSMEIASKVPNLQFRSAWGFSVPQFYIRGLGNRNFQTNAVSPVAVYIDNVVMGSGLSQTFQLLDLERAEVLRGPQGTLFGRNTSAGLLNFISKKPDPEAGNDGFVEATIGRFSEFGVEGAVNIPISSKVAARVAVKSSQRDGFFKDGTNTLGRDVGDQKSYQYRISLGYFGDGLEVIARIRGGELNNDQRPWKQIGTQGGPQCPIGKLNQQCFDFFGFSDSSDPYETFVGFIGEEDNQAIGFDTQVSWDISDALTLVYQGAYDEAENFRFVDEDFSPAAVLHTTYDSDVNFTSHELRLQSNNDGPLNWIAGVYYYADDLDQYYGASLVDIGFGGLASILTQDTESYAVFGNVEYQITDALKLRGGLRVTYDERKGTVNSFFFDANDYVDVPTTPGVARDLMQFEHVPLDAMEKDWTEPSGHLTISYEPNDDWHYFASYIRGFKGGDFNGGLFSSDETVLVDPEFVDSFELGVKASSSDGRFSFNATVFDMFISDQQVSSVTSVKGLPALILGNAAKSEIKGLELDFNWYITQKLSLKGALGLLDAKFDQYRNATADGADYSGNTLAYAPDMTVNVTARYENEYSFGMIAGQVGVRYVDEMFDQPSNDPVKFVDANSVFDAHISYTSLDDRWHVKLWVKNLTDEENVTAIFSGGGLGYEGLGYADPRTIGVTAGFRFK